VEAASGSLHLVKQPENGWGVWGEGLTTCEPVDNPDSEFSVPHLSLLRAGLTKVPGPAALSLPSLVGGCPADSGVGEFLTFPAASRWRFNLDWANGRASVDPEYV
jgi:hypothetical protein